MKTKQGVETSPITTPPPDEEKSREKKSSSHLLHPETEEQQPAERKRSTWAPAATATRFQDVPVLTICPYCNQKIVTKTQFRRGRKFWLVG